MIYEPYLIPGLVYGIGAIGVAMILRFLREPDFTAISSIVLGGIVCVYFTNISGPMMGFSMALVTGAFLGAITATLKCRFSVPLVLAGIITSTGATTFAFYLTNSGTISMDVEEGVIHSLFRAGEYTEVLFGAIIISFLLHLMMQTSVGSLILALGGDEKYVRIRHRYSDQVTYLLLIIGNTLISSAGALLAFRANQAVVQGYVDFFALALGAVFMGSAVSQFLSKKAESVMFVQGGDGSPGDDLSGANVVKRNLGYLLSERYDDAFKFGLQCMVYVIGSSIIYIFGGLAKELESGAIIKGIKLKDNSEYFVTSVMLFIFIVLANRGKRGR